MTSPSVVNDRDLPRVAQLLEEAMRLPPQDRAAYLRSRLTDRAELEEALGLLAVYPDADGPISRAIGAAMLRSPHGRRPSLLGQVIDERYRVVSILGRGGSGTVYLGERADQQYSAKVAIKVIDESASASFGPRFRAERQILANLNHPNIARLLDAGETEAHQPYLVMEYIQGESVDQYCDRHRLDLRARLELALQICQAVQYAHQNLIVHRDIKPANILVTSDGVPKLLDFGIAKLLDAGPSDLTRMNDRLLTPEYASPEQILGQPVTTVSDVYSLGVVLYQLLTGLRPYNLSSASASQLELERAICVTDPMRPSAAVRAAQSVVPTNGELSIGALAAARSTTPEKLVRELGGDLDAIVMRAMRKEPQLRYSSIEQLIADIRRYLANEPVHARQGNWAYFSSRFIRRHRVAVAAGVTVAALIVTSLIVLSIQRAAIQHALELVTQQKETAERVSGHFRDIFAAANPYVNFGREMSARELLDQARLGIDADPNMNPHVRSELQENIGVAYRRLGEANEAVEQLESALRLRRELDTDPSSPKILTNLVELAIAERDAGLTERSDEHFREVQELMANMGEPDPVARAKLLAEIGRLEAMRSRPLQALAAFDEALVLMRAAKGSRDPEIGSILSEQANLYTWIDDYARAEAVARQAVDIYKSVDVRHPDRVKADFMLAETLLYQQKLSAAAPLYERVLATQRTLFKSNPQVAETLSSLAQVRLGQGDTEAAERLVREAIAIHRDANSTAHGKIGFLQTMLATVLLQQSRFAEAADILRDTLDLFAESLPPDHQYVASAEHYLGEALTGTGELADAEAHLTAAMNRWKRTDAPAWRAARSASALGEVLHREGRHAEAERKLVDSYRILATADGVDVRTRDAARERVVRFYIETQRRAKLDALMRELHPAGASGANEERSL
jgi:serine/threonine protein kinase/TolA-binding protein